MPATAEFEEPIRILSDLHLGHPGCKVKSVAELRPLIKGARTVIFNGDTFELRKASLRPIADRHRKELDAMCAEIGARPIFVTGNHDPEISAIHYLDLAGGQAFLTHGDILYDDISPWSKLAQAIHEERDLVRAEYPDDYLDDLELRLKAAKKIALNTKVRQVKGKPGIVGKFKAVLAESWPPRRPMLILKTWLTSHHLAHELRDKFRPDSRFIIIGHTHRGLVHTAAGKHVINTGAFLALSNPHVVELSGDQLKVFKAKARSGAYHLGRIVKRFEL